MSETRIPIYSSKRFNSLSSKEDKDNFVKSYKSWLKNPFTRELIDHLNKELQREIEESEKDINFFTRFQFRFAEAYCKGKRSVLRKLLKII